MATDPATLFNQAPCYECYGGTQGLRGLMELAMLNQIVQAKAPGTDTSPATLLKNSACYACYGASAGALELMKLALLAQIIALGG